MTVITSDWLANTTAQGKCKPLADAERFDYYCSPLAASDARHEKVRHTGQVLDAAVLITWPEEAIPEDSTVFSLPERTARMLLNREHRSNVRDHVHTRKSQPIE